MFCCFVTRDWPHHELLYFQHTSLSFGIELAPIFKEGDGKQQFSTLEMPGLSFHGAPGPFDKFLRVSESEKRWETPPHSNNPTKRGCAQKKIVGDARAARGQEPPHQYPDWHLCLWLFPIHSFQPCPSTEWVSLHPHFSTPTILYPSPVIICTLAVLASPRHSLHCC